MRDEHPAGETLAGIAQTVTAVVVDIKSLKWIEDTFSLFHKTDDILFLNHYLGFFLSEITQNK